MLLQNKQTGTLVEILDVANLVNPAEQNIQGQVQSGQEEQSPEAIAKQELSFPSGEDLPRCWVDPDYQKNSPPGS
ncbi:MAG: acetyltransferase [Leptolyngbyaceae cyanobacterium SL_7_1]|nr:acetyltransferase [Leptolyngbyaceae cyanobacterium SL_7_1]